MISLITQGQYAVFALLLVALLLLLFCAFFRLPAQKHAPVYADLALADDKARLPPC